MNVDRRDWPQLLSLVEQALDLPASSREEWVDGLELSNSLKTALRTLIDERRVIESSAFLAELPRFPPESPLRIGSLLRSGMLIGPWRLLREIGRGGMSIIWLAEHDDVQFKRLVALKLPHAGPGQNMLAQRMLRERSILSALEHRNIARLYDVGITETGTPYLVMEYVEGENFLVHADAQLLTTAQRVSLFQQVLQAVQYAHSKLVLHRDLKPNNILVNSSGEVKLLDFGIAKLLSSDGNTLDDTELTQSFGRQLTPFYASPEQVLGRPLGTASDVYSLGLVLYELLCGSRPHARVGSSAARLEEAILSSDPKAPSRQPIDIELARLRGTSTSRLRKTLSGDLDAIVLMAMAKNPDSRYPSVEALSADLNRWAQGLPVVARAPSIWSYFAKYVARHKISVGLGSLAVALLMATAAVALMQARAAKLEAVRASTVRDFLVAMFNETSPDHALGKELTAKTLLENGHKRASATLKKSPELLAEMLHYIGRAQANASDRTFADQTLSESIDLYRQEQNKRGEILALLDQTDNALALGRHEVAQALLKQAEDLFGPFADDAYVTGSLLKKRGYVALFSDDWPVAKSSFESYLALASADSDSTPLDRVNVLSNLAWGFSAMAGDLHKSMALFEQAIGIINQHPEVPPSSRLNILNYQQDVTFNWGRYGEIERRSPQDIRECDQALRPDSPICLKLRIRLQASLLKLEIFSDAKALNATLKPMLDPASPRDRVQATVAMARTLAWNGSLTESPDLVQQLKTIAHSDSLSSISAPYRLMALNALAEIHVLTHQPEEALLWVNLANRLSAEHMLTASKEGRKSMLLEGAALQLQQRPDRALAVMNYFCSEEFRPNGMRRIPDSLLRLNCVFPLVQTGQKGRAIALLKNCLPALREGMGSQARPVRRAQEWLNDLTAGKVLTPSETAADFIFI